MRATLQVDQIGRDRLPLARVGRPTEREGAIAVGMVIFTIGSVANHTHAFSSLRNSWWIPLWLGGDLLLGWFGRYGDSARQSLPEGIDLLVVIVWSLAIYQLALALRLEPNGVSEEVAKDAHQLEGLDELTTA